MKIFDIRFPSATYQYLFLIIIIGWVSALGQTAFPKYHGLTLADSARSSSAIQTFDKTTTVQTVEYEKMHFINPTTGWVVRSNGTIRKTTTGGATWVEENSPTTNCLIHIYFVNENIGWACGFNGTILKTTNGGTDWTIQQSGVSQHLTYIHFVDENNGWVVGNAGTIVSTTNGGTVWTSQNSGITTDLNSISFTNTNNGWASGQAGVIVHTSNGGVTWTSQTTNTIIRIYTVEFLDNLNGWAAGGEYSTDSPIILRTTNGGASWVNISSSLPPLPALFDLDFIDANTGWIVGRYGFILRTTDGGSNWIDQGVDYSWLQSVSFVNSNTGWTNASDGTLLRTTDGGNNWTLLSLDNVVTPITANISISDVPNDNGKQVFVNWYTAGSPIDLGITNFSIYRYDQQNWTYLNDVPILNDSVYQVVVPTIFDSTKTDGMYWSVFRVIGHTANPAIYTVIGPDSGYSIDNLPPLAPTGGAAIQMPDGSVLVRWKPAINFNGDFKEYILYRSSQADFVPSISNRVAYVQDSVFIDRTSPGDGYYYKVTSEDYSGNESEPLTIARTTGVTLNSSDIPESFNLFQNFPNPFNPSTNINFDISEKSYVSLTVYDLSGREIAKLLSETMYPGHYSIPFHAANLSNGIYLYRLQTDKLLSTKKMILLK
jgi:photosystem II stability/assembly factor-like uncharacterized protein